MITEVTGGVNVVPPQIDVDRMTPLNPTLEEAAQELWAKLQADSKNIKVSRWDLYRINLRLLQFMTEHLMLQAKRLCKEPTTELRPRKAI